MGESSGSTSSLEVVQFMVTGLVSLTLWGEGTVGVLVGMGVGSMTFAFERVLELIVGGGVEGKELMSDKSIVRGFPSIVEWWELAALELLDIYRKCKAK